MIFPRKFSFNRAAARRTHAPQLILNVAILAAWLWLFRAMFDYLGVIAAREDFRTNQLILLGVGALVVYQIRRGQWQLQMHAAPRPYRLPLALVFGGSLAYLAVERWLDINTLAAVFFGVASYGLLGLYLAPSSWRQGLPAALLVIGVLPFGEHMQTFIGYPMRLVSAEIVRQGMLWLGIPSGGVDTILVLENGVAQIDLPCSGVKSLWTGALFLLAATWLDRRVVNARWLGLALLFAMLLFAANVTRVGALVVSAQVFDLPVLAQMLHVPLGVLGFVGACAAAVLMLRFCHATPVEYGLETESVPPTRFLAPFVLTSLVLMGMLYAPRPQTGLTSPAPAWNFPTALHVTLSPLKPDEIAWLTRDGAESATRFRFSYQGISGSMILVPSQTWRAHHYPERCFQVYGLRMDESHAQLIAQNFPVRAVTLRDPKTDAPLNAAYWFQAATRTTDDYGTRIWADTAGAPERWVLVSILFDAAVEPTDARVRALYQTLHQVVAGGSFHAQP
jgi:exosortase O